MRPPWAWRDPPQPEAGVLVCVCWAYAMLQDCCSRCCAVSVGSSGCLNPHGFNVRLEPCGVLPGHGPEQTIATAVPRCGHGLSLSSTLSDHEHEDRKDACQQQHRNQHLGEHQRYPSSSAPPKRNARSAIERAWPCSDSQTQKVFVMATSSFSNDYTLNIRR